MQMITTLVCLALDDLINMQLNLTITGTWLRNLFDADAVFDSILTQCHAAGPLHCQLYESSPEKVKAKYHKIMEDLKHEPIAVPAHDNFGPDIVTYIDALALVVQALYSPIIAPILSQIINELGNKNGLTLAAIKRQSTPVACNSPFCEKNPWSKSCQSPSFHGRASTASYAILCSDGRDVRHLNMNDHFSKYQTLTNQSVIMGGMWTEITMACSSWDIRPAWNFTQPIGATKTSHPLLFLSMMRDPVTPLINSRTMASKFPGSVVFGQDGDGHCTIAQPSLCVAKGIRGYFQTGEMPKGDMGCKPDRGVFGQKLAGSVEAEEADLETLGGLKTLSEHLSNRMLPLGVI
jgi:hypothetical protein